MSRNLEFAQDRFEYPLLSLVTFCALSLDRNTMKTEMSALVNRIVFYLLIVDKKRKMHHKNVFKYNLYFLLLNKISEYFFTKWIYCNIHNLYYNVI